MTAWLPLQHDCLDSLTATKVSQDVNISNKIQCFAHSEYCIGIWNHKKPAFEVDTGRYSICGGVVQGCGTCTYFMGLVAGLWASGLPSPGRGRAAVISPAADKMCQNYFPIIQQMKLTKNIIE